MTQILPFNYKLFFRIYSNNGKPSWLHTILIKRKYSIKCIWLCWVSRETALIYAFCEFYENWICFVFYANAIKIDCPLLKTWKITKHFPAAHKVSNRNRISDETRKRKRNKWSSSLTRRSRFSCLWVVFYAL